MFRECPKRAPHAACIEQRGGRSGRLLLRSPCDRLPSVLVQHTDGSEPLEHGPKVTQGVSADAKFDIVGVDEIEPEAIPNEDESTAI